MKSPAARAGLDIIEVKQARESFQSCSEAWANELCFRLGAGADFWIAPHRRRGSSAVIQLNGLR